MAIYKRFRIGSGTRERHSSSICLVEIHWLALGRRKGLYKKGYASINDLMNIAVSVAHLDEQRFVGPKRTNLGLDHQRLLHFATRLRSILAIKPERWDWSSEYP